MHFNVYADSETRKAVDHGKRIESEFLFLWVYIHSFHRDEETFVHFLFIIFTSFLLST